MSKATNKSRKLEGEGSYTAARQYDSDVRAFVDKGSVSSSAAAARRAVEGDESGELRRAEKKGKAGPKAATLKPTAKSGRRG
ncbi:MAG TPA: hypothetical protein VIW29_13200 [Polyangiaceae bacterium]